MDERVKFVAGLLDGEKMTVLCRRFGISRKTGYKILNRYNSCGLEGLTDRSRRPYRHANQLPVQIETLIVRSKQERPHWGAPKIRERLARLYPGVHTPALNGIFTPGCCQPGKVGYAGEESGLPNASARDWDDRRIQ
jgi:putative transposase